MVIFKIILFMAIIPASLYLLYIGIQLWKNLETTLFGFLYVAISVTTIVFTIIDFIKLFV